MSKRGQIGLMVVTTVLGTGMLHAQVAGTETPGTGAMGVDSSTSQTDPAQDAPIRAADRTQDTGVNQPQTVYVPALDGSGLIALDHSIHTRFLYGANYSGGYDSNPSDLAQGPSSGAFLISPFFGVESDAGNVQYVIQYQPTYRKYTEDQYSGGSLQTASLKVGGTVNERWRWDVEGTGSHGQDSIRFLAPQQNVAVGDIPGTGPNSASYRPDAGTITDVEGKAGVKYNASERDVISVNVENAFSTYSSIPGDSLIALGTIAYTHSVTPKFQWINYGQGARYYGVIHCFTYGGGVGLEWKPTEHAYLHLSGGPQVDTSGCSKQQGYAYNADFSTRISQKSQVYFTSARQAVSTFLGPGLWEKSVAVGLQHDFDKDQSLGVDFGYVGTTSLVGLMGYSGTYVDAGYSYRFNHSISASLNFRRYTGDWTDAAFTRNTALVSVSWAPSSGHIFQ